MTSLLPVAVYGLKVPAGDVMIPATVDFPATFRITMASIDPSAIPEHTGNVQEGKPVRATLKLVYDPSGPSRSEDDDDEEDSEDEEEVLKRLLNGDLEDDEDDEDSSSDDEETNGGPSDQSKTKKARKEAAAKELIAALADTGEDSDEDSEDDMELDEKPRVNGIAGKSNDKGKQKAVDIAGLKDDEDDEGDEDDSVDALEELVVCTLDPEKTYQQPLDITIPEDQLAYFKVSGNFAVYLTGNYVIPADDEPMRPMYDDDDDEEEEDGDYESVSDEDMLGDSESDELDDLEDPRITELSSEDEAPPLVKREEPKKGKNKRPAEDLDDDESAKLDDIMAKSLKPAVASQEEEPKLSKNQLKKLKKNNGKAAAAVPESKTVKEDEGKGKSDKKVSFAAELEQPPSSSAITNGAQKPAQTKTDVKAGSKPGVKVVQGVKIDDRKPGKGPAAKKGDRVGMRYIGKLHDGKVFDANKKGPPFKFKLGEGSVIKGWDIGVAGMAVGGERRIIIPPNLAYGNQKVAGIPQNSELTFDIKLLEIH